MQPTTSRALFAESVKLHRKRLGVAQVELSLAAGLGRNTVSNLEAKTSNVRLDTVNRLATSLDVDPCLLLSRRQAQTSAGYMERCLEEALTTNLSKFRKQLGLNQVEVSEAAGLPRKYVNRIESKGVSVTLDTLDALADAVQVEAWQLLA
ncbi:helix-turn-helix domain-containing protein [Paraburkholderia bannensis]|uniref:helix-turn-helix domain-containing protein n=1 Tax=Paraburkholderia bannensis TaxID=765414 RepID=UPI002AC33D3C|nr:helix-turn-helix transcriptional regulator [Paraburkholderia bannensis]